MVRRQASAIQSSLLWPASRDVADLGAGQGDRGRWSRPIYQDRQYAVKLCSCFLGVQKGKLFETVAVDDGFLSPTEAYTRQLPEPAPGTKRAHENIQRSSA